MTSNETMAVTSRIRPAAGRKRTWHIDGDTSFSLPVIVDHKGTNPATGAELYSVEATISLVDGRPQLVSMHVRSGFGIDPYRMQRDFRWASPVEIVTLGIPQLLAQGIDPFDFELPLTGFPEAAERMGRPNDKLTDDFLEEVAREYLRIGRGYAKAIADERHVSQRTVVSWIEKARQRGILSSVTPGSHGGRLLKPKSSRKRR